jgi:hypothetical protein
MDTRQWLGVVIVAILIGSASAGLAHATAGPDWAAAREIMGAEQKAAKATSTPTRPSAPVSDDLIYDFVGPNTQP